MAERVSVPEARTASRTSPAVGWSRAIWRRFLDSRFYTYLFPYWVRRLVRAAEGTRRGTDEGYRRYLEAQIARSAFVSRKGHDGQAKDRTIHLVGMLQPFLTSSGRQVSVLCVGCRDAREIDYIEGTCGARVVGVDLFSLDPRIRVADMHQLPFGDGEFDCVYSCNSLEHAFDADRALAEFVRVVRPGGVLTLEVPIDFEPGQVDRHDFKSVAGLLARIGPATDVVLAQEEGLRHVNGERRREARLIVRIGRPAARAASASPAP